MNLYRYAMFILPWVVRRQCSVCQSTNVPFFDAGVAGTRLMPGCTDGPSAVDVA